MEPKISKKTAKRMVAVAATFDAVDLAIDALSLGTVGAVISPFLTVVAYGTMGIWFVKRGVNLRNLKNFFWFNGTFMFELIPYLGDLPALTAGTFRMIALTNAEGTPAAQVLNMAKPQAPSVRTEFARPSVPPPTTASQASASAPASRNVLTLSSPQSGQGSSSKAS